MSILQPDLVQQVESIGTSAELAAFIRDLLADLQAHPEGWENPSLDCYLEALSAWIEDMDGYFSNQGQPTPKTPSWSLLAQSLLAARVYE